MVLKYKYNICQYLINIDKEMNLDWQKFSSNRKIFIHLKVFVEKNKYNKSEPYNDTYFSQRHVFLYIKYKNALLSANDDWSEACITLLDGKEDGLEGALIAAIMTHLSLHHGLMLHSSLIDVDGSGIMFVGPSGIGKTTQAELWMKYRDAIIINGDMALVHEEDGVFRGYGCPWHGSSPYCENRDVLLKGIIVLEQASENTIEKLDGLVLFERMVNNIFIPHWFKPGVESAMETIDHLLTNVPVYLLKCRKDEEAVSMVERVLLK